MLMWHTTPADRLSEILRGVRVDGAVSMGQGIGGLGLCARFNWILGHDGCRYYWPVNQKSAGRGVTSSRQACKGLLIM
jgi:hypothetical protein